MINGALTQHNPTDADNTSCAFFSTLANFKLQLLDIAAPFLVILKSPLLPAVIFCSFLYAPVQFISASISEGLSAVNNQLWFAVHSQDCGVLFWISDRISDHTITVFYECCTAKKNSFFGLFSVFIYLINPWMMLVNLSRALQQELRLKQFAVDGPLSLSWAKGFQDGNTHCAAVAHTPLVCQSF